MSVPGTAASPGTRSRPTASRAAPRRSKVRWSQAMRHRVLSWVIVTLPLLVLAERGWSRRHMSDDGYIHLRVVKQLIAGHGPVFNVGERVEASTGPLIRPDLGIFTLLFLLTLIVGTWGRTSAREQVRTVALALAAPLLYELFRLGYYASPVPNPAIAKEATRARWDSGWGYLQRALNDYWVWFPLIVLAFGPYVPLFRRLTGRRDRRAALVAAAFGLGGIVHALYVVRVGGDFMHARLLLPSLFAVAAPVALVPLDRRYLLALPVGPWALVP